MTDGWELVARWPGGTVSALAAVDGGDGSVLALAATAAGLHASSDGGEQWSWQGLGPSAVPETLAISPSFGEDGAILLGAGNGLYRSTDQGRRWRPVLVGSRVQCLAAAAASSESAIMLAGTESDGILRSEDGGLDWAGVSAGLLDLNVTALAISPAVARDRTAFAGTASGLYRSRNGGRAWRVVELGPETPVIQALAISPCLADDGLVLAGTESDGLFRSDDGGQSWEPVAGFPSACVTSLAFARPGEGARRIAAGTAAGVALSEDGGETWELEAPELGPILSLAWVPESRADGGGDVLLAGTIDAGVARRDPADSGWREANVGLAGRATVDLALSTAYGSVPLLAVASLDAGVLLSHDAGASWKTGYYGLDGLAATSLTFAQTPGGQPRLLAAIGSRVFWSEDIQSGWQPMELAVGSDARVSALNGIGQTDRPTSVVLATGPGTLLLSEDGGVSWRGLPLPTTRADIVGAAASPTVARDRTVYAVARATKVGADGSLESDGLELWYSSDLGQRWTRWLHSPSATVMPLVVPPPGALDTSLLVGHAGRVARPLRSAQEVRRGERRPLWQEAQIGDLGAAVTAVALSPRVGRDRVVVAASEGQVYLSRDGGDAFATWDHDLDVPLVTALAVAATEDGGLTAYALGLGGTLWQRTV
jgi:hypothetical protein